MKFAILVTFATYVSLTVAVKSQERKQVLSLTDLTDGVYSLQIRRTRSDCALFGNEYLAFNNRTCTASLLSGKTAGPNMKGPSTSMMWREWLIQSVVDSESDNRKDITLQAFITNEEKAKEAKCLGMVSTFYGNPNYKFTCGIPPYGTSLFLNETMISDSAIIDAQWVFTVSATDEEGEFHIVASGKPNSCAHVLSVRGCESMPFLALMDEVKDKEVSSSWKFVKLYDVMGESPPPMPAGPSPEPSSSPPSPSWSTDPLPPAPATGPVISGPSSVSDPLFNVLVSSFGGDQSCSVQRVVFEYGLGNGATPVQTMDVEVSGYQTTIEASLQLNQGNGYYSIYAFGVCSSNSTRTERSNGLSVFVNVPFAPLFYLGSNKVTVECPSAPNNASGMVNGILYTKRDLNQILSLVSQKEYGEIERTCTSDITSLHSVFKNDATFNGNIGTWDVKSVTTMQSTFENATSFNQDIQFWDTRSLTSLLDTFKGASNFNQPLPTNGNQWYTGLVTSMERTFKDAAQFNQDISSWETHKVTSLRGMFNRAYQFNKPLSTNGNQWSTSAVEDMHNLFFDATAFNQDIRSWETHKVTDMHGVFHNAESFNQPLPWDGNKWNTASVTTMKWMFDNAKVFDQDISGWTVSGVTDCYHFDNKTSASWTAVEKPTFSVSCT